ncbi:MAG: hypothetical protein ACHQ9S_22905 [Candidatus Binatia bacterium]
MKKRYLHTSSSPMLHIVLLAGAFVMLASSPRTTEAAPCISFGWVNNFLTTYHNTTNGRYGSPEAPHTATYYNAAQTNEVTPIPALGMYAAVDPRLVLAISGAESHFGTDQTCCTPYNNDWDWGGPCGSCKHYNDLDTPISAVVTGLTQTYMAALGLVTIEAMSTHYCGNDCGPPPNWCKTGANAWICNVKSFYASILGTSGNVSDLTYFQPDAIGTCCTGDCNNNGVVTVDEILTVINIALMNTDPSACPAATYRDGGFVSIQNAMDSVNLSLVGCRQ